MANLQGYRGGAVGSMLNHWTRHYGDPDQEEYRYNNQRIDKSRTHLNYSLFERADPVGFIRTRVAEADAVPRRTANVVSDWVITLPRNDRLAGREKEFFQAAFDFIKSYVGEENVVGFWVHRDETSDHAHCAFVPLCEQASTTNDKSQPLLNKDGSPKVDSKGTPMYKRVPKLDEHGNPVVKKTVAQSKLFDRRTMKEFHPRLSAFMEERFGFDVGVELEDEGDKILSKLDHGEYIAAKTTLKKTKAEVERLEDKREEIRKLASEESARLEDLQRSRSDAGERVEILEAVAAGCRAAGDAPVSRKGALLDRIAAICTEFLEKLGAVVEKAKDTAHQRLVIAIGRSGDEGPGFGGRWTSSGVLASPTPMAQPQKEYTL